MPKKVKDTLFIDMKYVILYRKLGYREIDVDCFRKEYPDTEIIIESERQRYRFHDKYYTLHSYKDFALLECIDRLLEKGYDSKDLNPISTRYDLDVYNDGKILFSVLAQQWGRDYDELCKQYVHDSENPICLYTSQLSGGLVDYISKIHYGGKIFDTGLFEKESEPYQMSLGFRMPGAKYPSEFKVVNNELIHYGGSCTVVAIPEGIVRIGAGAFWNNTRVKEIRMPASVNCIGGDSFVYCENLENVNIPSSVDRMGDDPFAGCPKLVIENNSSSFIQENDVLFDKTGKTLIHYSPWKKDTDYSIPDTVEWIGKHSFYKCNNLRTVKISKNVSYMGNNPFSDCRNIVLVNDSPHLIYENGVLYDRHATTTMHYSMGSGVKNVSLRPTVKTIGRNCFWNCDMIENLTIPESVRQIGYNPFANCTNINIKNESPLFTTINGALFDANGIELICCPSAAAVETFEIPGSVVNLGRNCFTGCRELRKITIPPNVAYIGRNAFSGCSSLEEIEIPDTVEEIGDWCFNNCSSLKKAYLPSELSIKPNTFSGTNVEVIRK